MTTWDYRIATKIIQANNSSIPWREFLIVECYYNDNNVEHAYIATDPTQGWDNPKELINTLKLILKAKSKPILDLDNWPNEWHKNK